MLQHLSRVNNMHGGFLYWRRSLLRIVEKPTKAKLKHDGGNASNKVHLADIHLNSRTATDCM